MVGSSTDNADFKSVSFVPARESVKDIYPGTSIEIIDCSFAVDVPGQWCNRFIHGTPPYRF